MTKQLILLEQGVEPQRFVDFIREVDNEGDSLVLAEKSANLSRLKNPNIKIRSIDEYVPPLGTLDGRLKSDARSLVDRWIAQPPLCEYRQALEYDGISLWETASYNVFTHTLSIIQRAEVLKTVLTSVEWQRVYLLVNRRTLWAPFHLVAANIGFASDVQEISMTEPGGSPSLKGHSYQRVAQVFVNQAVFGIHNRPRLGRQLKVLSSFEQSHSKVFVFLVGYTASGIHLSTLLPVIEATGTLGQVLVLDQGGAKKRSQPLEHGLELPYWAQQVPLLALPRIVRRTLELRRVWDKLQNDERVQLQFEYHGIDLWPALRGMLRAVFLRLFPRMMVKIEALKRILEAVQPSAMVVTPDIQRTARIALALARRYGIPSLYVQPCLISNHPETWPIYADRAAVLDDYSRRAYLEHGGVTWEQLVITGLPRWDGIFQVNWKSAMPEARARLGLSSEDRFVVFATDNIALSYTARAIQAVMRAMSRYADMRLVIKVHPAESSETYDTLLTALNWIGCRPIVVADIDLHALLAASSLLVTGFSNVALEAVLLDKPVIIFSLAGEPDPLPFIQDGIVLGAYSEAEIEQQVDRIMSDPLTVEQLRARRHQYMQHNPQLFDGKATDRVVDLLRQMTHS